MDAQEIDRVLSEAERVLEGGGKTDLKRLGFWKAVASVKRDRALVDRYADRIGAIDRRAFEQSVLIRFPAAFGLLLDLGGVAVGIALIYVSSHWFGVSLPQPLGSSPWRELSFLAGFGALLGMSHTLAHWVVGTLMGIKFTHFFSVPPLRPQPGFKIDYASYLRTPAYQRAWMHASGAIVTKLVPFGVYPFAIGDGLQPWAVWTILAIGFIQIATDAFISVKASDWKKFRREMRVRCP